MSAAPPDDATADLQRLLNHIQVSAESARRRATIDVVVQAWSDIGDTISHSCPRTLSLKPDDDDENLFALLDRLIPCQFWGVLSADGCVWYIHHTASSIAKEPSTVLSPSNTASDTVFVAPYHAF